MSHTEEKISTLDNLKGTKEYEELEALHNSAVSQVKREDISGAIKGKSEIFNQARELIGDAKKEVLICMPALELFEKSRVFGSIFERLKTQDIKIRLVLSGNEEELKKVASKYNIKPQKTDVHSKFFVVDRKQVLFAINHPQKEEDEMAVWLNSDFFSGAFASIFESSLRK